MKRSVVIFIALAIVLASYAQEVDYKVVSVNEESGIEFTKITTENDYVCMPQVKRTRSGISWFTNKILAQAQKSVGAASPRYPNIIQQTLLIGGKVLSFRHGNKRYSIHI